MTLDNQATAGLASYAVRETESRGRRFREAAPSYRNEYQRDRDRIVHSGAFRRLEYKTQVFVNHEGDMFRTRLTHSVEVAQIGRSISRVLRLNEDLTEAIALAHDLGHTPFGHAGQDALNHCMEEFGGFEHNLQSLRVVDELEERYAEFNGLNLTYETREGILKHCSARNAATMGELGERFLRRQQPSLEAQLANMADEIAYNNHDVDDGLRSGLISLAELEQIPFFAEQSDAVRHRYPDCPEPQLWREAIRRMINALVVDLIETSSARIAEAAPGSIDEVRGLAGPLIGFSEPMAEAERQLKRFLRTNLYTHPHVQKMTQSAHETIHELYAAFIGDLDLMPAKHAERARRAATDGPSGVARAIADYIAGMTDRFALDARERLRSGRSLDGALLR
jgi:dGTPase